MNLPNPKPNAYTNQRRSQRILLSVPVVISGRRVNAHGALIVLHERVLRGQTLRMKNVATGEEINCTVMDITTGMSPAPEVGLEFVEPSPHFWRVSFPPPDWSPRSAEAKRPLSK